MKERLTKLTKKKKLKDFVTEPLSCRKERKQDFCGHCWPFLSLALSYGYLKCYMKFKAVSFKCHMHNDKKSNKKKKQEKVSQDYYFFA